MTDKPDIKIFPPLAFLIALLLTNGLSLSAPLPILPAFSWGGLFLVGLLVIAGGIFIGVSGTKAFKAAGTNVNPNMPSLKIVETGVYRFTRNPMYLGMVLVILGVSIGFSLDWGLIFGPLLLAVLHFGVVLKEEEYLIRKFGEDYTQYLGRTRRWI